MVEVFKTNVQNSVQAAALLVHIHNAFPAYQANFDLDDCDKILRIKSSSASIKEAHLVELLAHFGFRAEVLGDTPVAERMDDSGAAITAAF